MTILLASLLNLNALLPHLLTTWGPGLYVGLFALIFIETGLVIFPFLPGDSVLFLCGSLAAITSTFSLPILVITLTLAAILGDFVNFEIGKRIGSSLLHRPHIGHLINPQHLKQATTFFERYGSLAIFLGRFIPIVRTFIPFTAGISTMHYPTFARYNLLGGITWITVGLGAGYLFGNITIVRQNFELIMLAIVFISVLPLVIAFARKQRPSK